VPDRPPPPCHREQRCDLRRLYHGVGLCARGSVVPGVRVLGAAAPDARGRARRQIINETLPALAKLCKEGTVRYVGFSGLPLDAFKYILDRRARGACAAARTGAARARAPSG
jgi:hypothetical protein